MHPARPGQKASLLAIEAAMVVLAILAFATMLKVLVSDFPGPPALDRAQGVVNPLSALKSGLEGLAVVMVFGLAVAGIGGMRRQPNGGERIPVFDDLIVDTAIGLGILAMGFLGLGLAGLLKPLLVFPLLLFFAAGMLTRISLPEGLLAGRGIRLLAGVCLVSLLGYAVGALVPATEIDSLFYHLEHARVFAMNGFVSLEAVRNSPFYFSNWELLLVPPLVAGGEYAAGFMNVLVIALTAFLLRGALGRKAPYGGLLAVALWIVSITTCILSSSCKNDLVAALFCLLAFRFALAARAGRAIAPAWWSGLALGFALGVKYTVLPAVAVSFVLLAWPAGGETGWKISAKRLVAGVAACAAAFGPWVLLNYFWTGNPVFPFASGILGGGISESVQSGLPAEWYSFLRGDYFGLSGKLRAAWTIATVDGNEILPLLALLALPLIGRPGAGRVWIVCGLAETALWLAGPPRPRYMMPALLLFCGGLEYAVGGMKGPVRRRVLLLLLGAVILTEAVHGRLVNGRDMAFRSSVALGLRSSDEYRDARLGGCWRVARWVNSELPLSAGVMAFGEIRTFPFRRRMLSRARTELPVFLSAAAESWDVPHLERKLRQLGATHLVYNRTTAVFRRREFSAIKPGLRAMGLWGRYFRGHARLLYDAPFVDINNGAYYVFELGAPSGSGIVLPGCEGWLWEPERLMAEGKPEEAKKLFDGLVRDLGGFAIIRQAYASVLADVIGSVQAEEMLSQVDRDGLRSVDLLERLARYSAGRGDQPSADRYRARARALEFSEWRKTGKGRE